MSIELINKTPYIASAWDYLNPQGGTFGVGLLRGRFTFRALDGEMEQWQLDVAKQQGSLFSADQFHGEIGQSSLQYESDYVPYKSGTDIILNATARTPKKQPKAEWDCGILVENTARKVLASKILHVSGTRQWNNSLLGWKLSDATPCHEVPLRYENAYGGSAIKTDKHGNFLSYRKFNTHNPVGKGNIHYLDTSDRYPAPQISHIDNPLTSALDDSDPAGFGFIARGWQPRLALAGTYDEDWLAKKHPLLPDDFDVEHYRSASQGLALPNYLQGGEKILLKHFHAEHAVVRFQLPDYQFFSSLITEEGGFIVQALALDTVLLDIESADISEWSVYLSWRGQHILPETATALELFGLDKTEEASRQQSNTGESP